MTLDIAVIIGSTRPERLGPDVGRWVHEHASKRNDANFELIDLADHQLPHLDEVGLGSAYQNQHTKDWSAKIAPFDGYVFVTAEYNHSIPSALKGAIDFLSTEWANKAAAIVSYGGGSGGARAAEHLRLVLTELRVANIRTQLTLPMTTEFKDFTTFAPGDYQLPFMERMLDELIAWSGALKPLRTQNR